MYFNRNQEIFINNAFCLKTFYGTGTLFNETRKFTFGKTQFNGLLFRYFIFSGTIIFTLNVNYATHVQKQNARTYII